MVDGETWSRLHDSTYSPLGKATSLRHVSVHVDSVIVVSAQPLHPLPLAMAVTGDAVGCAFATAVQSCAVTFITNVTTSIKKTQECLRVRITVDNLTPGTANHNHGLNASRARRR